MSFKRFGIALGVTALASLSFNPAPVAADDPGAPTTQTNLVGVCTVDGDVTVDPGVNSTPKPSTYKFIQTAINCVSDNPLINGSYAVTAQGATSAQSDCTSDASPTDGDITVIKQGGPNNGKTYAGHVNFERVSSTVHAWGHLDGDINGPHELHILFDTMLQFSPNPAAQATACIPGATNNIETADLTGEARVYL